MFVINSIFSADVSSHFPRHLSVVAIAWTSPHVTLNIRHQSDPSAAVLAAAAAVSGR